jgi:ParB family chromosome partitioning protein
MFDEAKSIATMMKMRNLTQGEVAKMLGVSQSYVANKLRLLKLDESMRERIIKADLSERHARALLRLQEEDIMEVLQKVIDRKLNVTQTEKLVDEYVSRGKAPKRQTKIMFSDVKIFLNTINNALDTMQKAGIKAQFRREDKDDSYIYFIEIPKRSVYKTKESPEKEGDINTA